MGALKLFDPLIPILTVLIVAGVKEFFDKVLKRPLPSGESAVLATLVLALVAFADTLSAALPAAAVPAIAAFVTFVVALATAFGLHAVAKGIK